MTRSVQGQRCFPFEAWVTCVHAFCNQGKAQETHLMYLYFKHDKNNSKVLQAKNEITYKGIFLKGHTSPSSITHIISQEFLLYILLDFPMHLKAHNILFVQ